MNPKDKVFSPGLYKKLAESGLEGLTHMQVGAQHVLEWWSDAWLEVQAGERGAGLQRWHAYAMRLTLR